MIRGVLWERVLVLHGLELERDLRAVGEMLLGVLWDRALALHALEGNWKEMPISQGLFLFPVQQFLNYFSGY